MALKQQTSAPARIPVTFHVGKHLVRLHGRPGVWNVEVDGTAWPSSYSTEAEAWEVGVREADRLDRLSA